LYIFIVFSNTSGCLALNTILYYPSSLELKAFGLRVQRRLSQDFYYARFIPSLVTYLPMRSYYELSLQHRHWDNTAYTQSPIQLMSNSLLNERLNVSQTLAANIN